MNAKLEFINCVSEYRVKAAQISINECVFTLKTEYTKDEYDDFIESLGIEYDDGYGTQELSGTIWCEDGVWITRGEYDGSEWWNVNKLPEIPDNLRNKSREREKKINEILK